MESDEPPDAADASDWDTDELFSDDGDIDEFSDWDCDMDSDSDQETRAYRTPRDLGRQEWAKRVDSLYDHEFKRFTARQEGSFTATLGPKALPIASAPVSRGTTSTPAHCGEDQ